MDNKKNKKYKFLGINIIDLTVLLVIIGLIVAAVMYFVSAPKAAGDEYLITYRTDELSSFVADKVKEGNKIADFKTLQDLGVCTKATQGAPVLIGADANGDFVTTTELKNYVSLEVQGKYQGTLGSQGGIVIDGKEMCIGDFVTIFVGDAKLYIRIDDISPINK